MKWQAFCRWQQQPFEVAPKSEERHRCHTCGEEFEGNYCPRCGQSAKIGRYSLKKALLLFLDVWGLGNRSMFRTLRDLLLRPGYMIRDYITGMQMAYFPPFKLLFLLTALLIAVQSGVNMAGKNLTETDVRKEAVTAERQGGDFEVAGQWMGRKIGEFSTEHPNVSTLAMLLAMSVFIYFLVRRCPAIPDLRFSEMLVAMVYSCDMMTLYAIAVSFLGIYSSNFIYAQLSLLIIPLKQLTGFKWWRATLVVLLSYLYAMMLMTIAVIASYFIMNRL